VKTPGFTEIDLVSHSGNSARVNEEKIVKTEWNSLTKSLMNEKGGKDEK
jgi:hypothetical protein